MFEKKKLWMVLAAATLVAACGGGSDPAPVTGGGGGGGGGSSEDTSLASHLVAHPDQIIVNGLLPVSAYEDTTAENGGLYGQDMGTDDNGAPFRTFGLRIDDLAAVTEGAITEETATGRLAITLTERAETVVEGETPENVQIAITGVTLATDATGLLTASQAEGATMYVSGTTADGESFENVAVTLPANIIRIVPITDVPGGAGAVSDDVALIFDLDAAFSAAEGAAQTDLAKLAALSGRFDMTFALSTADIYRSGEPLDDQTVTAAGQTVTGSGIPGNIWITELPVFP